MVTFISSSWCFCSSSSSSRRRRRWCSGAFFLVWAVLAVAYSITTFLLINAFSTVASDIAVRTICGRTSTQDGTHYPCSEAVFMDRLVNMGVKTWHPCSREVLVASVSNTASEQGRHLDTRVYGPWTRPVDTGSVYQARAISCEEEASKFLDPDRD